MQLFFLMIAMLGLIVPIRGRRRTPPTGHPAPARPVPAHPADDVRKRISARLGDALSLQDLASSVLKRYEDEGRPPADLPYVHWSLQDAL